MRRVGLVTPPAGVWMGLCPSCHTLEACCSTVYLVGVGVAAVALLKHKDNSGNY